MQVWVYMVRLKGEDAIATELRIRTIMEALFPPGSKSLSPREASPIVFVRILVFIAFVSQETPTLCRPALLSANACVHALC